MGSKSELFKVLELVEQGRLAPVLDRVMPLTQAAEAHGLLTDRRTFGNVVLEPDLPLPAKRGEGRGEGP